MAYSWMINGKADFWLNKGIKPLHTITVFKFAAVKCQVATAMVHGRNQTELIANNNT